MGIIIWRTLLGVIGLYWMGWIGDRLDESSDAWGGLLCGMNWKNWQSVAWNCLETMDTQCGVPVMLAGQLAKTCFS